MARNEPRDETTGFYLWRTSHCRVCKCGVSSVASISAFHSAKGDKPIIWFSKSPRCADSGSPWLQCKALSHEAREEVEQHMADTVFLGWRIDGWRIGFQLLIQLVQLCLRYTMIITELHISNPGNIFAEATAICQLPWATHFLCPEAHAGVSLICFQPVLRFKVDFCTILWSPIFLVTMIW